MAHTIAASGFHVSLILGLALAFVQARSPQIQFAVGVTALLIFVCLTGLHPSILRAALMGLGGLIALVLGQRTKPLGLLLLAAIVLLLINPFWIWDLGFQLSFLATFGLLITAPAVTKRLDRLPPRLAAMVAIPVAASLWTIPLQLWVFGVFSPYSIGVNIVTAPLVALICVGGVVSGLGAALWPPLGMGVAWVLQYPVALLLVIVEWGNGLPGSAIAVGNITMVQLLVLYGLMVWLWLDSKITKPKIAQHWLMVAMAMAGLVFFPAWHNQATLSRLTFVAGAEMPALVVQDRGRVGLVNSGGPDTAIYTLQPFFQHQGINQLAWALDTVPSQDNLQGWLRLLNQLPIRQFYHWNPGSSRAGLVHNAESINTESTNSSTTNSSTTGRQQWTQGALESALAPGQGTYHPLGPNPSLAFNTLQLQALTPDFQVWQGRWHNTDWLWLLDRSIDPAQLLLDPVNLPQGSWLWWPGQALTPELLTRLQPKGAIASAPWIDPETVAWFETRSVPLYWTGRDGALQWWPGGRVETTISLIDREEF